MSLLPARTNAGAAQKVEMELSVEKNDAGGGAVFTDAEHPLAFPPPPCSYRTRTSGLILSCVCKHLGKNTTASLRVKPFEFQQKPGSRSAGPLVVPRVSHLLSPIVEFFCCAAIVVSSVQFLAQPNRPWMLVNLFSPR